MQLRKTFALSLQGVLAGLIIMTCAALQSAQAQSVVVNKYFNSGTTADVLELLVIQNNLDMRGMIIKDFSSSMATDSGGKYQFSTNALWSSVRSGTLIVLRNDTSAADVTVGGADYNLDLGLMNTTYFSLVTGTFDIATTEMVMIKAAGSGDAGVTGSIHVLAGGTAGAQFTAAPTPKLRATGTSAGGTFVYANSSTQSIADYNGTDATGAATGLTFGSGNNANNTAYINSLRGAGGGPTLSINNVTQNEGNAGSSAFTFTVTLSQASASNVTFDIATADGTAQDGTPGGEDTDYQANSLTNQSIAAGNTTYQFTVQVNGDTTPEANETFFVNVTNVVGSTPSSLQGTATITNDDVTSTQIHTIQGSGLTSPFVGQNVTTTGIVTGRKTSGFFIQEPDATADADTTTSEAIFVFTSSAPSATINVGDSVQVTGTVVEFISPTSTEPATPADPRTATEITSPTTVNMSSGNPLPTALDAVTLNIFNSSAVSRSAELEKYEYMRVSVPSITVSAPTNPFGEFWGVKTSLPRPFREPGIERGDPIPTADTGPYAGSQPPSPTIFDGNFERIQVDSDDATSTANVRRAAVQVTNGAVVTGVVGPLDYAFDTYRIVLDFSVTPGVTPGITAAIPVPLRTAQEFTIGHANLENFTAADATKMSKASLAIRNVMRTPDVVGLIEILDLNTMQQLATKINTDAANPAINYVAYMGTVSGTQNLGYLVNSTRVTVVGTPQQYHSANTFTFCGVTSVLHDRPSYQLTATVPRAGGGTIQFTVILNHTKSLIGVDSLQPYGTCGTGTEGARNREKRRLQAEDIADLIASRINENLVVLGDLNAFDFSDGLTDVVGTLKGIPTPPEQVVEPSTPDRWNYLLTNLLSTLPLDQQYSFAFEGNAQALDHVIVNQPMLNRLSRFAYGRLNGDFDNSYASDASRPERVADHDTPVAYFTDAPTAADGTVGGRITDSNGVPIAGAVVNLSGTQNRKFITDANGNYRFDNVETTGFYTVRPTLANYSFSPGERSFSQLGNNTEATFTGARSGAAVNVIDTPEYFVRQNYLDFLGREPDESGFNFWSDQILSCGNDAACSERQAISVSAAYFLSIEFQQTGGLVDGLYRASYARAPRYGEFMPDAAVVGREVVVGRTDWAQKLEANKQAFVAAWIERSDFRAAYDGLSNSAFVDSLISHAGGFNGNRDTLVNGLNSGTLTRAAALRQVVENEGFVNAKRNETFVMMEYFGYLRREPDTTGYNFWLNKLNQFDGNFERAEMVKAFIVSDEYRNRFR